MKKSEIYYYLRSRLSRDREVVMSRVNELRRSSRLERVYALGSITLSSYCIRDCIYCGFRAEQMAAGRFRLSRSQIFKAAESALRAGFKWLMLRSGYDPGLGTDSLAELVRDLSSRVGLNVALSLGEREPAVYEQWRQAGAGAYWLRHETCDPHLYRRIKPSMYWVDRIRSLEAVKHSGLSLGTGIMIGIPNQSFESLVEDIMIFKDPAIFGVVIEPYTPPPGSPGYRLIKKPENLIVNSELASMEKLIAITRVFKPNAIIPLTNAHAALYKSLELNNLFQAGANALLFDFTPVEFSELEAQAPFTGVNAQEPGALESIRQRLDEMGLELTFDPPRLDPADFAGTEGTR